MRIMAVACYKPKAGKDRELADLVNKHYNILKSENVVTDRLPVKMKSEDGTIIEVFEWKSEEDKQRAHSNPNVKEIWKRFEAISDNIPISALPESKDQYANFHPV
jgi:hypothetical protein